ncbi:SlyX family protein [Desulfotalea psychrophila]|uniref:SlyX family protein n=1 Tax=Desulfotalea psychrophila TaxID=84980 RepID=UPI00030E3704|nr:SlyX family protein [Desulfotalea psychrophila]
MVAETEERIQRLEEDFEFQDTTIATLNQVIIDQQQQINTLFLELEKLKHALVAMGTGTEDQGPDPLPPHY